MIKPRLFSLLKGSNRYLCYTILWNIALLLLNAVIVFTLARILSDIRIGIPVREWVAARAAILGAAVCLRFFCQKGSVRASYLASVRVKKTLRERIYRKLLELGISYQERFSTAEVVQAAMEGVDQLEVYFGKYLPQLAYSLLAPVILFFLLLPVNGKAPAVLLICVPLIPVSIGLQCRGYEVDFQLHPDTVRLLHRLEERCVMGVRGNYTAEILSRYGLRNFQVIGCPSVFFREEYAFDSRQPPTPETTVCNYKTFWGGFRPGELAFLEYCRKYQLAFVEQTCQTVEEVLGEKSGLYQEWLNQKKQLFFSLEEWDRFLQQFSFCLGMRFHGNVLAMQNGARALYLVSDSRTRELTEFFHFPSLEIGAFDPEKSLEAYWEMARYEEFTKVFPEKQENLREFAKKNGLIVNL